MAKGKKKSVKGGSEAKITKMARGRGRIASSKELDAFAKRAESQSKGFGRAEANQTAREAKKRKPGPPIRR